MKVQGNGRITIPKHLRESYGLHKDVEVDVLPVEDGLLLRRCATPLQPSTDGGEFSPKSLGWGKDKAIMGGLYETVDDYVRDIRGH